MFRIYYNMIFKICQSLKIEIISGCEKLFCMCLSGMQ